MVGSSIPRRGWFLARSDAFRNKTLAKFYGFIGIIPIYRLLEGAEGLQKNDETFERCTGLSRETKLLLFIPKAYACRNDVCGRSGKVQPESRSGRRKNNFNLDLIVVRLDLIILQHHGNSEAPCMWNSVNQCR